MHVRITVLNPSFYLPVCHTHLVEDNSTFIVPSTLFNLHPSMTTTLTDFIPLIVFPLTFTFITEPMITLYINCETPPDGSTQEREREREVS